MRTSAVPLSSINPKYHAQITAALHGNGPRPVPSVKSDCGKAGGGAAPMIRQNSEGLNKTEAAFQDYLRAKYAGSQILAQCVTLKLGNGVKYTPDFIRIADATNEHASPVSQWTAWEVKGFMRDDAAVKIKVAAAMYPLIQFYLVRRNGRIGWRVDHVLP